MIRAYAPPPDWSEDTIALAGDEAHHLVRVLRARVGDTVEVVDGEGRRAWGALERVERRGATVRAHRVETDPAPSDLGLIVALLKGDRNEEIIEKAVETGIARVWGVQCERSIVRLDPGREATRLERWRRTAIEALKQCGRARLPELRLFDSVAELAASRAADEVWILGALLPEARPLREVAETVSRSGARRVSALIGPEGDFTPEEYRILLEAGARPASFGPWVLRADTAALFAAGALALFFPSR